MNPAITELLRKTVHISVGLFALTLRFLTPHQAMVCAGIALVFNLFVVNRLTRNALLRHYEKTRGWSLGIILYPAAVLAVIVVFQDRLELAAATWGLIAFGDGMAALFGVAVGGPRLPWNLAKTWIGFAAFVLWGTAAAAFLLRFTQLGALDAPKFWIGPSFLAVGPETPLLAPTFLIAGCFAAALLAGLAESARTGIDDNIVVPLVGGAALYAATLVEPHRLADLSPVLSRNAAIGAAVNAVLAAAAYAARSIDVSGVVVGWCLGVALYAFAGWRGFALLLLFFILGTACTKLGYSKKALLGIAQEEGGRRSAKHAIANTGVAVIFAFLAVATPHPDPFRLALVAAFATAAADTVASEIGQAFGRTTYLVTSFKRVRAGTDGAVSLEGTLAGIVASAFLAAFAAATSLITWPGVRRRRHRRLHRHHPREFPRRNPRTPQRHRQRGRELRQYPCGRTRGDGIWALL
jgi:uncharacterized protein (TIGR00297 family)